MEQTERLVETLKRCLRARGLTYRDVANALHISEASVKRVFAEHSFSLRRLEEICKYLDMEIYELAKLARSKEDEARRLSLEQETALAEDPSLLTYFYLLINGWLPARIDREYGLSAARADAAIRELERLRLVKRLPRKRVKLLTSSTIIWHRDGPVRRRYERQVKSEFLSTDFGQTNEFLELATAELSAASMAIMHRKIERLLDEFYELAEIDTTLPHQQRRGVGFLAAFRPWAFSLLAKRHSRR